MDTMYNGWENRETWACSMWLNNVEYLYRTKEELKKSAKSWQEYSDQLKGLIYEIEHEMQENMDAELLNIILDIGSLYRINFDDIAKNEFGTK